MSYCTIKREKVALGNMQVKIQSNDIENNSKINEIGDNNFYAEFSIKSK